MVGMADALSFAQQMDLDLAETREMILGGTAAPVPWEQLAPKSLDGDWKPGFMVTHFLKDLRLALAAAEEKELALPGADTAFTLYDMLDAIGGQQAGHPGHHVAVPGGGRRRGGWSRLVAPTIPPSTNEGEHECGCGHHHEDGHECCGGHGDHHGHHEGGCCCGGHGHDAE